jgi:hypothetical protein
MFGNDAGGITTVARPRRRSTSTRRATSRARRLTGEPRRHDPHAAVDADKGAELHADRRLDRPDRRRDAEHGFDATATFVGAMAPTTDRGLTKYPQNSVRAARTGLFR